tara:strand:+ start:432 stop:1082 length:651 start_codon:yes stop_codon:yes gene_type:complete
MTRYFYKETGMYIDWEQLKNLPDIDTFIDVGVGADGTPDLYQKFQEKKLVLIDPLDEAEKFYKENMQQVDAIFYKTALGESTGSLKINIEENIGRSTILDVSDINFEGNPVEQREISVNTLDDVLKNDQLGKIGIKIDTEGYELNVILGAKKTLSNTKFVIAEVRHNHESFNGVYKLHEFITEMHKNGFVLSMILTAKPFIADLCFEPIKELDKNS